MFYNNYFVLVLSSIFYVHTSINKAKNITAKTKAITTYAKRILISSLSISPIDHPCIHFIETIAFARDSRLFLRIYLLFPTPHPTLFLN